MSTDLPDGMKLCMDGEAENARENDTGTEGMDDLVELEIENGEIKLVPRHIAMQYIAQKQYYDDASDNLGARRKKRRINKPWKVPMVVQLVLGFIMVSVTCFALWYSYLGGELEIRAHFERKKNLLGRSVLRAAAENKDAACKELLERGAYVNFQLLMKIQEAPWHTTLSKENEWVSLSATWSEAAFSNSNASTLDKIAERNVANPLQTLFDFSWLAKGQTADWTATPLAAAVYHGAVDAVALLLLHGADPNMLVRNHEETVAPLLIAAQCAKFPAISREAHCNPIMMKLLKAGAQASVALPSRDQRSPLHLLLEHAHHRGQFEVAFALLKAGGNPNMRAKSGRTPLHEVEANPQLTENEREQLRALLVHFGADSSTPPPSRSRRLLLQW